MGFCRLILKVAPLLLLAAGPITRAAAPIQVADTVRQNPNERLYVTRIDLTNPRVTIVISPGGPRPTEEPTFETVLRPPSAVARTLNLDVAVNGVFFIHKCRDGDSHHYFVGDPANGANAVMIDGQYVTDSHIGWAVAFDEKNKASICEIDKSHAAPAGTRQLIAGNVHLVEGGKNVAGTDNDTSPRTSLGLADGGKTLVILVVDGRRPDWSAGMSLKELADTMIQLGCIDAVNLDGGGSSTIVRKTPAGKYKVINTPSDGSTLFLPLSVERPVAYTFGVRLKP